jgi:hypothetical protein
VFSVFTNRFLANDLQESDCHYSTHEVFFHSLIYFFPSLLNHSTAISRDSLNSHSSQSQSYFTIGGLPLISSPWLQTPWDSRPEILFFFNWALAVIVRMKHPLWREDESVSYEYAWSFVKYTFCIYCMLLKFSFFCARHKSSVSTGFTEQIMPILRILSYNGSLVIWTVVDLTTATYIFYVWLSLVLYHEHVHSHNFVWLLLLACTIFLYNRIHKEGWRLCANRGPLCTLENFQRCVKYCSAGAAILRVDVSR